MPVQPHVAAMVSWGDAPTWIAAIGTVGAFIAAFVQIATERRLRHDREVKEQARLVAAVTGPALTAPPVGPESPGWVGPVPAGEDRTGIDLINGSPEPVYKLVTGIVYVQGTAPRTLEKWLEFRRRRGS